MATPSKIVACNICGKKFKARGLYGHIKLKHHVLLSKTAQGGAKPSSDSSHDSSEKEIKQHNSGGTARNETSAPGESASHRPSYYIGMLGLETDRQNFTPSLFETIKYYKNHPDIAKRKWKELSLLKTKYSWVIYNESYKALSRIFEV